VLPPEAVAYYELGLERDRLTARTGRLEFARTWELLQRFLPAGPATICDVGGGPGAYAIPLARAGHTVHLVDAVPLHVEQGLAAAAEAGTELGSATVGDARSLDFPDASADAVLLLGPLYHLVEETDRLAALAEARRVLRPGGVVCGASISRFAPLIESLRHGWAAGRRVLVESGLTTGTHLNPDGPVEMFTTIHVARPEELAAEFTAAGFADVTVYAIEGPGTQLADVDAWLDDPELGDWLLSLVRRVETEPSILGMSPHALAVGRVS
jgi:ubiquinone/menaquinone biosynthesis C-methylase UbiE